MQDIPLHDIKGLVEVPDNSFILLMIIVVVLGLVIFSVLGVFIYKFYNKNRSLNLRKVYLQKIHEVNIQDAKTAAYEISLYGRLLAQSDREIEMLDSLDQRLQKYKYKKDVEKLDDDTLSYYQLFLEVVDAS